MVKDTHNILTEPLTLEELKKYAFISAVKYSNADKLIARFAVCSRLMGEGYVYYSDSTGNYETIYRNVEEKMPIPDMLKKVNSYIKKRGWTVKGTTVDRANEIRKESWGDDYVPIKALEGHSPRAPRKTGIASLQNAYKRML